MKFCSECGSASMAWQVPAGDNRPRHICLDCNAVYYQNPKIVVGSIPEWEDRILLCRRAIAPRHGYWTLPAGFMENGETTPEAAERETLEEANARIEILHLYTVLNIPHTNQVYMMFRSRLLDLEYSPGSESLEVALFREEDVPWSSLAFPTIEQTLRLYFEDRRRADFGVHLGDIGTDWRDKRFIKRRSRD
ncbi:MAG: NUDIX hydrolase [Gammaproteobacteria bacterium]|nr:NUDIX hydrolase [Gammaproteobacteria bacterium]